MVLVTDVYLLQLRTNRTGHASSVLGNVRARHSELQRIEQTLSELAILYQELATIVEQQEPVVQAAEQNAMNTNEHMIKGNEQVEVAKKHAQNRRKLKWWCALVVLLIIIAIAVGVGVGVSVANNNK
jgi:syntaxin 1B/2/3